MKFRLYNRSSNYLTKNKMELLITTTKMMTIWKNRMKRAVCLTSQTPPIPTMKCTASTIKTGMIWLKTIVKWAMICLTKSQNSNHRKRIAMTIAEYGNTILSQKIMINNNMMKIKNNMIRNSAMTMKLMMTSIWMSNKTTTLMSNSISKTFKTQMGMSITNRIKSKTMKISNNKMINIWRNTTMKRPNKISKRVHIMIATLVFGRWQIK